MPATGIDKLQYMDAWAKMMITIWQDKMIEKNIHDTGEMFQSFNTELHFQSNGDVGKIVHTYNYYGRMVDMGVGRGVKKGDVEDSGRKPKEWYGKSYYHSIKVLSEKMAELYGEEFQSIIHQTLQF